MFQNEIIKQVVAAVVGGAISGGAVLLELKISSAVTKIEIQTIQKELAYIRKKIDQ